MRVKNSFVQKSFVWNRYSDDDFKDAAKRLSDIVDYLRALGEPVYGQSDLYYQEILQETPIYSFFERDEDDPLNDAKQMVILLLQGMSTDEDNETFDDQIGLQFYATEKPGEEPVRQSADLAQYFFQRRDILIGCISCQEFSSFMKTCFPDIIFAEDIEKGICGIPDFGHRSVREAIVHDLGVLNDEALDLYRKYHPDTSKMYQALETKVLACSIDTPKHNKHLHFSFSYINDAEKTQIKSVLCSPHTKLIRRDSNLRIYFAWQDADIGNGEKILVGRIGGHPYSKNR